MSPEHDDQEELERLRVIARDVEVVRHQASQWAAAYQDMTHRRLWLVLEWVAKMRKRVVRGGARRIAKVLYVALGRWRVTDHLRQRIRLGRPVRAPAAYPGGGVDFAAAPTPRVSIVIPVHQQVDYTWNCLLKLRDRTQPGVAQIIVVDDASTDRTPELLDASSGVVAVMNEENLGFCGSVNRGAEVATGEYLVLLNNDTEVQPGWLDALVEAMESADDVGAVGAKLVYPDGRLQEAGGLIWNDASGWNYGHKQDPRLSQFNFRREVDYCSGAALMVRRSEFERLGRLDRRYDPGFYEDVDLCFSLRAAGLRTLYEPTAVVTHFGGVTFGTETRRGVAEHTRAAQYANQTVFATKWADTLTHHLDPGAFGGFRGSRSPAPTTVLVCDEWVPAHDRDAGSLRMSWVVRLLAELGCRVTLFPRNRDGRQPYTADLERAGVEVHHGRTPFAAFAAERRGAYDIVIVSRPNVGHEFLDDIERHFRDAVVLYDTVDIHFVREQRRLALTGEGPGREVEEIRAAETDLIRRATATVAVTEDDARVLRETVPGTRTFILPTVHPLSDVPPPGFSERADLVFIGGYQHPPNVDAVRYFIEEVLPLIRRWRHLRLWVLGADPPLEIQRLQTHDIVFTGYVPDADAFLRQSRVFVAPLRYGSGMKGKIGHAMAMGLPVVTTTIGAEGMGLVDGKTALLADDSASFADAVVRLHEDTELWTLLSKEGQARVAAEWSPDATRERLKTLLSEFVPNRP